MDMIYVICAVLFFGLITFIVLGNYLPEYRKHQEVTGGIVNHDPMMSKFVYKIPMDRETMIGRLSNDNEFDEICCTFDLHRSVMRFSLYGSRKEFFFRVQEREGVQILTLEDASCFKTQDMLTYRINPFLIETLQAEPIPFGKYGN